MRSQLTHQALALAAAAMLLCSCLDEREIETVNHVNVGDSVPAFTVTSTDGDTFASSSFTGKRSLLLLFATWCPDCEQELAHVEQVWQHFRDDPDVLIIPISRDQPAADVTAYWQKNGFEMPVYLDPGRVAFDKFANQTIPRIYLIDTSGRISEMWVNTPVSDNALIPKIDRLP